MTFRKLSFVALLSLAACGVAPDVESTNQPLWKIPISSGGTISQPGTPPHAVDDVCEAPPLLNLVTQWDRVSSLWNGQSGVIVTITADSVVGQLLRVPSGWLYYVGIDTFWQKTVFWGYSNSGYDYTWDLQAMAGSCHSSGLRPWLGSAPAEPPGQDTNPPGIIFETQCKALKACLEIAQQQETSGSCHF